MIFYGKCKDLKILPDNQQEWLDYMEQNDGKSVVINIDRETGVRTPKQNDSLHLYFDHLAQALNEAGLDMKKVLKPSVDIEWTKDNIKKYIWKPLQLAITGKKSTKELDKVNEIKTIYMTIHRHMVDKFKIDVDFPHEKDEFDIQSVHENLEKPEGVVPF